MELHSQEMCGNSLDIFYSGEKLPDISHKFLCIESLNALSKPFLHILGENVSTLLPWPWFSTSSTFSDSQSEVNNSRDLCHTNTGIPASLSESSSDFY